jgi:hypothetical protein
MPTGDERRSTNASGRQSRSCRSRLPRSGVPGENLRSSKRQAPPREVDCVERTAVNPCRTLEERAKLAGRRNADLIHKALDVGLRQGGRELDLVAVLVDKPGRLSASNRLEWIHRQSMTIAERWPVGNDEGNGINILVTGATETLGGVFTRGRTASRFRRAQHIRLRVGTLSSHRRV